MAGIKDVAKLAGVSPSTVSKCLNTPELVRKKNREAILDAIEKLNYTPNLFARNLRVQNSRTIAVIAQEITNPFHALIYNTIRKEALKERYSVTLYSINDIGGDIRMLFESMPLHYFSGGILCYFHDMDKSMEFAQSNRDFPFVIMSNDDYYENDENIRIIYSDFAQGIEKVTTHIIERGKRDIAYVGCMTRKPDREPKFRGFMHTMEKYGLKPHSVTRLQQEYTIGTGYKSAKIILAHDRRPDAILVDNDIMAMGVMRCLEDEGIRIPEEIIVTGFDDIAMASAYCPALTTVHVPIEEMSIKSFRLLMNLIDKTEPKQNITHFVPELVVRETT